MPYNVRGLLQLINWGKSWWVLIILLLQTGGQSVSTYICGQMMSLLQSPDQFNEYLIYLAICYSVVSVISFFSSFATAFGGSKIGNELRARVTHELMCKNSEFFEQKSTGTLINVLGDCHIIQGTFSVILPEIIRQSLTAIGYFVVVAISYPLFSVVLIGEAALTLLVSFACAKKILDYNYERQSCVKKHADVQSEMVMNWKAMRVLNLGEFFRQRVKNVLSKKLHFEKLAALLTGAQEAISFLICGATTVMLAYWAGILYWQNAIKIGDLYVVWSSSTAILSCIKMLSIRLGDMLIMSYLYSDVEKVASFNKDRFQHNGSIKADLNCDWKVELKDVSFAYPGSRANIIKSINLKAEPNSMTAFVGPSGSGKSTTLNLILNLYGNYDGEVLLNGINTHNIDVFGYFNSIGYVSQEVSIFDGSIEDNIKYGNLDCALVDIEAASRLANIHSYIMSLPEGYKTMVGERGVKLSGGQRQRLALARALVRKPKLLILDEATSALDSQSEKLIQQAIDKVSESVTTIVIAHRLSTIKNASIIYVFMEGTIVEQGKYDDLVRQNGMFAAMVHAQALDDDIYSQRSGRATRSFTLA